MVNALGVLQLLVMYAGLLLLGQGMVYRFFRFLTSPVTRVVRRITPARVADRHVPVVAFFLLFWIYFALAVAIPQVAGVR